MNLFAIPLASLLKSTSPSLQRAFSTQQSSLFLASSALRWWLGFRSLLESFLDSFFKMPGACTGNQQVLILSNETISSTCVNRGKITARFSRCIQMDGDLAYLSKNVLCFYTVRGATRCELSLRKCTSLLQKFHFSCCITVGDYCQNCPKTSKREKSLMLNYGTEWKPAILAPVLLQPNQESFQELLVYLLFPFWCAYRWSSF